MKIAMIPLKSTMDLVENIKQIEALMPQYQGYDLLLFGEGYLQGYESLSFDYEKDIRKVSGLFSEEILELRRIARENCMALGFGFYENDKGGIYNSYLVLGKEGETLFKQQALSDNWQKVGACADYRRGVSLGSFLLEDRRLSILLEDDFFEDAYLLWLCELDDQVDGFIWVSAKEDPRARERSEILAKEVLYLVEDKAFLLKQGKVLKESPAGGPLSHELEGKGLVYLGDKDYS